MATFPVYNLNGEKVGTVTQPALFATPVDEKLIHRYFVWVRSLLRHTIANTKTRGEVSGGGKKPWRQKGTGRARSGSIRNPVWRTGGTIFGPRHEQSFATRMPRQERRKALFAALSAKAEAGSVVILEEWQMKAPKTKEALAILDKLPTKGKKVLQIIPEYEAATVLSTRNVPTVQTTTLNELNIVDILNHDVLLLTKASLAALEKHFNV